MVNGNHQLRFFCHRKASATAVMDGRVDYLDEIGILSALGR